ncbi:uncharacterized protein LOC131437641 [Malaya genurostris]|uniref:uncharacterized protein LOC131437641 n=1 Tax=Malaya genurostris TaxID=325434 RepID=UPI0026F395A5|nr:uncharacterized protein LOC131437641 [Malaya genurostris]
MKLQYDLEGNVIEQRKSLISWGSKVALCGLLLAVLLVGSAVGSIIFQRYYDGTDGLNPGLLDDEEVTASRNIRIEEFAFAAGEKLTTEKILLQGTFDDASTNLSPVSYYAIENEPIISSTVAEDIIADVPDQKPYFTEIYTVAEPEQNSVVESAVLKFEINQDGLSVHYGEDEDRMTEISKDSQLGQLAGHVLQELFLTEDKMHSSNEGNANSVSLNSPEQIKLDSSEEKLAKSVDSVGSSETENEKEHSEYDEIGETVDEDDSESPEDDSMVVVKYEANENGITFKYGHSDDSLKELSGDSSSLVELLLQQLFSLASDIQDTDQSGDLSSNEADKEEISWSLIPGSFLYRDGHWTFRPAANENGAKQETTDLSLEIHYNA